MALTKASTAPPADETATKPGLGFLAGDPLTKTTFPFLLKFLIPYLITFAYPQAYEKNFCNLAYSF